MLVPRDGKKLREALRLFSQSASALSQAADTGSLQNMSFNQLPSNATASPDTPPQLEQQSGQAPVIDLGFGDTKDQAKQ